MAARRLVQPTISTEQYFVRELAQRGGEHGFLSKDGCDVFDLIGGKHGDGYTGDAVCLEGITGDTITRGWIGKEKNSKDLCIYEFCLNVCVMVRPEKFGQLVNRRELQDFGLVSRIVTVAPPSKVGSSNRSAG